MRISTSSCLSALPIEIVEWADLLKKPEGIAEKGRFGDAERPDPGFFERDARWKLARF